MSHISPIERVIRNLLDAQRLVNGISLEAEVVWQRLFSDIEREIRRRDPTEPSAARFRRLRAERVIEAVAASARQSGSDVQRLLRESVARTGSFQADWAEEQLRHFVGRFGVDIRPAKGLGVNHFKRLLDNNPFQGDLLRDWVRTQPPSIVRRVRRQINIGIARDETLGQIVRRVRGTRRGFIRQDPRTGRFVPRSFRGARVTPRYVGGVIDATRRDTESIVRTAVNFVQNTAHRRMYERNADVVTGLQFEAVLDDRTTLICARWSGTVWKIDDPKVQTPPLHYGCRSVLSPVIDWEGLGLEEPDEGFRAAKTGVAQRGARVRAGVDYQRWLRDQPFTVQVRVLGRRRAELFRSGRITLKDMVDERNQIVTLEELEAA